MRLGVIAYTVASLLTPAVFCQDAAPKPAPRYKFFSGKISDLNDSALKVGRTLPGKQPEERTFVLTPETKVEGGDLQQDARVTVAFVADEDREVAKRIIVRKRRTPHSQAAKPN